jgi:Ni,Fe-hydrogenase III small subunit
MRKLVLEKLLRRPVTEAAPAVEDAALAALGRSVDLRGQAPARPLALDPRGRRRLRAMAASWRSTRCRTPSTIWSASACAFVASPRHADVLLVTGPVTKNMREALERTYNATPGPEMGRAVGDCAADGGILPAAMRWSAGSIRSFRSTCIIRGCPPDPTALLKGLLALMEPAVTKTEA